MGIAVKSAGAAEVNGSISTYYLKDPANPSWDEDAGMKLYMQIMAKYLPGKDTKNGLYLYGMAKAYDTVQELRQTGANLTRASFMHTVRNSTIAGNPFGLPTVKTTTGPKDHFPISQQRLIRFADGQWTPFGRLIDPRK